MVQLAIADVYAHWQVKIHPVLKFLKWWETYHGQITGQLTKFKNKGNQDKFT